METNSAKESFISWRVPFHLTIGSIRPHPTINHIQSRRNHEEFRTLWKLHDYSHEIFNVSFKDYPWFYDLLTLLLQVARGLHTKFCVIWLICFPAWWLVNSKMTPSVIGVFWSIRLLKVINKIVQQNGVIKCFTKT